MDDRDKGLTHLFVRDLDEIPLPARGEWRRVAGRETIVTRSTRYLLAARAVVAVVAIALIVGLQLGQRQQNAANPSASPTPSASQVTVVAPSASPSSSPCLGPCGATGPASSAPGGAIYNDDFGFIVTAGNAGMRLRTESSTANLATFPAAVFAVSPDGNAIAYWKPGAGSNGEGAQLHLLGVVANSVDQTLVTLASDQRGGGIAWSSDGAGLVYSTETGSFGIGGATNSATLNTYELASADRALQGRTIDTQTNTGWLYRPLAWDRSANLAVAGLTGEGGFMGMYETVRINADNSLNVSRVDTASRGMSMGSIHASSDAKLVLGVALGSGDLSWWPIDNYGAAKTEPGAGKRGALWRPGTHQIGFMSGEQLWLGDVDKAGAQGLCCTAFSGAPATSTLRMFRADGSAVVLTVQVVPGGSPPPVSQTQYTLVRIGSDPKATSGDRVTLEVAGELMASVRLR